MEERRRHDDEEVVVLAVRFDNLVAQLEREEKLSLEWRQIFCKKLDVVIERLDSLNCKVHVGTMEHQRRDIGWLQKIVYTSLCVIFPALIGIGIAWGSLSNLVDINTKKWEVLEPEHKEVIKDIEVLKEKSYGYRGVPVMVDTHGKSSV